MKFERIGVVRTCLEWLSSPIWCKSARYELIILGPMTHEECGCAPSPFKM